MTAPSAKMTPKAQLTNNYLYARWILDYQSDTDAEHDT